MPLTRSWTKTSSTPLVSPAARLLARLSKATTRPSAESEGDKLTLSPWMPDESTLTLVVWPVRRSCTKMSREPFVSPPTRFVAALWKATICPSAERAAAALKSSPWTPAVLTLTRVVVTPPGSSKIPFPSASRSWMKTSSAPLVSPGRRFVAELSKATKRPSADMAGARLAPSAWPPAESTLVRTVATPPGSSKKPFPSASRSWTKTSIRALVSPATRLEAALWNATKRPFADSTGAALTPSAWAPPTPTLTRTVATPPGSSKMPFPSASRSWTKTSGRPLVSPATRLVAALTNATKRPSADSATSRAFWPLEPSACTPSGPTLTRTVCWTAPAASEWRKKTLPPDAARLRPFTRGAASTAKFRPAVASTAPVPTWRNTRRMVSNTSESPSASRPNCCGSGSRNAATRSSAATAGKLNGGCSTRATARPAAPPTPIGRVWPVVRSRSVSTRSSRSPSPFRSVPAIASLTANVKTSPVPPSPSSGTGLSASAR